MGQTTELGMYKRPHRFHPPFQAGSGVLWSDWHNSGGESGEEPPAEIKELFDLVTKWQALPMGSPEYIAAGKELIRKNLEGMYAIGTVAMAPSALLLDKDIVNMPTGELVFSHDFGYWGLFEQDQWFFE
jgi:hypothetical protein